MTTTHESEVRSSDAARIREFIEARTAAAHAHDVDGLITGYAADVVSFDAVGPLRFLGVAQIRERAEQWSTAYRTPIGYEIRDLDVTVGDDVAFCHFLYHVSGTMTTGTEVDMWVRATVCMVKAGERWTIVHEHDSVPFDATTGAAELALVPGEA